jgi:acetoin utilization deacetylase AcuC-like enzyme
VLFVSSHRVPFYPGTGAVTEIGTGRGRGFTVNLPLPAGQGDADLLHAWSAVAAPIVDEWQPELVIVSCGLDTWRDDPLGGWRVTERGFAALFGLYGAWAARHCPGRLVFVLEGGYDPAGVEAGVRAALEVIAGRRGAVRIDEDPGAAALRVALSARHALADVWRSLR